MKITVCFNSIRVVVPCGNGELSVRDLIKRAVSRYKKATNKHPDDFVQVQVLETSEEQGILDPDDVVSDVLDDRDKVVAVFEEQLVNRPSHNGGDGMSASSAGTASPDIFQAEISSINEDSGIKTLLQTKDENHNDTVSKLIVVSSHVKKKPVPPPVPPKPKSHKLKEPSVSTDSVPSEDSGICVNTKTVNETGPSKVKKPSLNPRVKCIRTAETAFVAIGTPITNKQFNFSDTEERNPSSSEFVQVDDEEDDEGCFSFGRNSSRRSMFVDNPVLDRWAELQEKKMYEETSSTKGQVTSEERQEPAGASLSPTEERTFEHNVFDNDQTDEKDGISNDSACTGDSDDAIAIELHPNTQGDLGFTVAGYKTADGRELGLIVRDIFSKGCAARDGRLQVADRIIEINGNNLLDLSNKSAEELFSTSIEAPEVRLVVSGAHSFIPGNQDTEPGTEHQKTEALVQSLPGRTPVNNGIEPPPGFRDDGKFIQNGPQISSNVRKINRKILIELNKGPDGLGFSITTRDNPAGGHTPIFVKSILAKGAAIEDGQLKSGDQILEVNSGKMTGKSQGEAVNILRSTRGLVKLLIQREEIIQAPTKPVLEVNEESTRFLRDLGRQVLTFKIPLNNSGAAGLGVSVKGKMGKDENGRNSPLDKGIFVKSVIAGGAAQKDGRLQDNDQLLSVNNVSFLGISNSEAIDSLRSSMQTTRLGQAFIEVTVARDKSYSEDTIEGLNQSEQERPIEAAMQTPTESAPQLPYDVRGVQVNGIDQESQEDYSDDDDEDDEFSAEPVILNLSITKSRNAVQRNESYCCAVNKNMNPFQKRPLRPSPLLTREPARSSGTMRTSIPGNIPNRPSSTVAMPTPSVSTSLDGSDVIDGPAGHKGRNPTPVPPPRVDSFKNALIANYHINQHIGGPKSNGKYGATIVNGKPPRPINRTAPPIVPTVVPTEQASAQARTPDEDLPSYDQALALIRTSTGSDELEVFDENKDVVLASPDLPNDTPFDREGFGRQSMSEKRARASIDAKKTETYQKRERQKLAEGQDGKDEIRPSTSHSEDNSGSSLRKAISDGHMQVNTVEGLSAREASSSMYRSTSESSLKAGGEDGRKRSTSNLSFRSAIGGSSGSVVRDMPNGVPRQSQSEDNQDEIPITMTSKADFNAVQQKLHVKKPFYRKFKIGKTRRGEYNLTDSEGSPKHSLYNQEALIDFPSEQRYRQLVSHYDDDASRSSSLPNRKQNGNDRSDVNNQVSNQQGNVKIGRVIVSEPTRV